MCDINDIINDIINGIINDISTAIHLDIVRVKDKGGGLSYPGLTMTMTRTMTSLRMGEQDILGYRGYRGYI